MLPPALRFGISRSHGGPHPLESATPFAAALAAALHIRVDVKIARDYDELSELVAAGNVQVAWMAPVAHARAARRGAVLAAVTERRGTLTYRSALLVRNDSMVTSLRGLRGLRAAWTDAASASGYLYARLHLETAGIDARHDLAGETFYGSTKAAAEAVLRGDAEFCACYAPDAAGARPELALDNLDEVLAGARARFRVLAVSDPIPPDGIVLSERLPPAAQAVVRDALLTLHERPAGLMALRALLQADRLRGVTHEVQTLIARLRAHGHVG